MFKLRKQFVFLGSKLTELCFLLFLDSWRNQKVYVETQFTLTGSHILVFTHNYT